MVYLISLNLHKILNFTRKCSLFSLNEPRKFDFVQRIGLSLRRIRSRITAWCFGLFMYKVFLGPVEIYKLRCHAFRIFNPITLRDRVHIDGHEKIISTAVFRIGIECHFSLQ